MLKSKKKRHSRGVSKLYVRREYKNVGNVEHIHFLLTFTFRKLVPFFFSTFQAGTNNPLVTLHVADLQNVQNSIKIYNLKPPMDLTLSTWVQKPFLPTFKLEKIVHFLKKQFCSHFTAFFWKENYFKEALKCFCMFSLCIVLPKIIMFLLRLYWVPVWYPWLRGI